MKIPEINSLQMNSTNIAHIGKNSKVENIADVLNTQNSAKESIEKTGKSFQDYLMDAMNTMNSQQMEVSNLQEKVITDPDSVDIHDVTIAMSKARMSLNLAQTVIDRVVTSWNEITTTR